MLKLLEVGKAVLVSNKRLKKLGVDAEAFKKDIMGRKSGGRLNIAKDQDGNIFFVPVEKGAREPVPTGITLDELIRAAE